MARKRSTRPAETMEQAPAHSPLEEAPLEPPQPQRPECLTCPLKECRGKYTRARSEMGGGRTIHYVACTTCGVGNSYDEQAATVQPETAQPEA